MREVQCRHEHVWDALHALALKMVLGHPEGAVAEPVHQLRHRLGLVEYRRQLLVRQAALVHRDPAIADIVHIDMAGEQAVEFRDHGGLLAERTAGIVNPETVTGQTSEGPGHGPSELESAAVRRAGAKN